MTSTNSIAEHNARCLDKIRSDVLDAISKLRGDSANLYRADKPGPDESGGPIVIVDITRGAVSVPIATCVGLDVTGAVGRALDFLDSFCG